MKPIPISSVLGVKGEKMVWIAIALLAILEVVHCIYVRDRMEMIEQMNSTTLRKMWEFLYDVDNNEMRGMR